MVPNLVMASWIRVTHGLPNFELGRLLAALPNIATQEQLCGAMLHVRGRASRKRDFTPEVRMGALCTQAV